MDLEILVEDQTNKLKIINLEEENLQTTIDVKNIKKIIDNKIVHKEVDSKLEDKGEEDLGEPEEECNIMIENKDLSQKRIDHKDNIFSKIVKKMRIIETIGNSRIKEALGRMRNIETIEKIKNREVIEKKTIIEAKEKTIETIIEIIEKIRTQGILVVSESEVYLFYSFLFI